ncbi:ferredoxin [Streptomyces sp. AS02]|uniref:ferredoxin n=1 Tax=Streptomyces sp. AS02 TaxID=2938946 RepID=UPI0020220351|nr:ferredoxin [Streptomyces sp. AS02]MCL8015564.1 ferredoxin [Streptomyces sp. AS02]
MKVNVDQGRCCGAGQCVLIAPEVFDQRDDDGIVTLLEPSPAADVHAAVRGQEDADQQENQLLRPGPVP